MSAVELRNSGVAGVVVERRVQLMLGQDPEVYAFH